MRPLGAESETILLHRSAHGGPSYVTIVTRNARRRVSADARNLRRCASDSARNVRFPRPFVFGRCLRRPRRADRPTVPRATAKASIRQLRSDRRRRRINGRHGGNRARVPVPRGRHAQLRIEARAKHRAATGGATVWPLGSSSGIRKGRLLVPILATPQNGNMRCAFSISPRRSPCR